MADQWQEGYLPQTDVAKGWQEGTLPEAKTSDGEIRQGPPAWKYNVSNVIRPIAEGLGLVGGGIIGTAAEPGVGTVGGAALGYGIGRQGANLLDEKLGISKPATFKESATRSLNDMKTGAELEMGGQILGPMIGGAAKQLNKMGYSLAEKSLKVPPSVPSATRSNVINTMLDNGIPISKSGLAKAKGILTDLNDQMDMAVASSPNKNNLIDTNAVLGPVQDLRDKMLNTVNGKELAAKLDGVVKSFTSQYGPQMTVEQAQTVKQNTNALLSKAYGQIQDVTTESIKQVVRGLKDQIAEAIPEISGINANYGKMKDLEKWLERAVNRTGNWDILSLAPAVAGGMVGGATGSVVKGAEAMGLWRVLKSPPVQSNIAIKLSRIGAKDPTVMARAITSAVYARVTGNYQTPLEQSTLTTGGQ